MNNIAFFFGRSLSTVSKLAGKLVVLTYPSPYPATLPLAVYEHFCKDSSVTGGLRSEAEILESNTDKSSIHYISMAHPLLRLLNKWSSHLDGEIVELLPKTRCASLPLASMLVKSLATKVNTVALYFTTCNCTPSMTFPRPGCKQLDPPLWYNAPR